MRQRKMKQQKMKMCIRDRKMDRTEDRSKEPKTKLVLDDGRIESIQEFISPEELYQDLIERVRKYHPSDDISMIEKAYRLADNAHRCV